MFQVGDKVSWTHFGTGRRTITMTLRQGVIESIKHDVATVKKQGGRREDVALSWLRHEGQPSQLSEFVDGMRTAARDDP